MRVNIKKWPSNREKVKKIRKYVENEEDKDLSPERTRYFVSMSCSAL